MSLGELGPTRALHAELSASGRPNARLRTSPPSTRHRMLNEQVGSLTMAFRLFVDLDTKRPAGGSTP